MKTLLFYVFFELISLIFFYKAEICRKKEKNSEANRNMEKSKTIKKSSLFLILSFIPVFILVAFRDKTVGVDTINYTQTFLRIANGNILMSDKSWLGTGYVLLCQIIGFFSKNSYVFYNSVIAFFTLFFFFKGMWKDNEKPTISLFLLFSTCLYYQTFNQARQMLAIAIVFYNYKNIINNNFKHFIIYCLLATAIHSSAIVMLPFYFLSKLKINKKNIFSYLLIAVVLIFFYQFFENFILNTSYGTIYSKTGYFQANNSSIINLAFRLLLLIVCYIFVYFTDKKFSDERTMKLFNLCVWCVLLQLITIRIYIFGRITTYFFMSFIILIPHIYNQINEKHIKRLFYLGMVSLFLVYHVLYYSSVSITSGYDDYSFYRK